MCRAVAMFRSRIGPTGARGSRVVGRGVWRVWALSGLADFWRMLLWLGCSSLLRVAGLSP